MHAGIHLMHRWLGHVCRWPWHIRAHIWISHKNFETYFISIYAYIISLKVHIQKRLESYSTKTDDMQTHTYTQSHTYICTRTHAHTRTCTYMPRARDKNKHTHTHICTHIHTHTHANTCTHIADTLPHTLPQKNTKKEHELLELPAFLATTKEVGRTEAFKE